mmetsp:Transcript_46199/g.108412  ORF Transcript_46199/g.108412 Transcript_46199/m.108412 type:complete len:367 (-) Transcript_46199:260-1360(-)
MRRGGGRFWAWRRNRAAANTNGNETERGVRTVVGLDALPHVADLPSGVGDEDQRDERARDEVDHGGLRHVQRAHDHLAHCQPHAVPQHRRRKVARLLVDALGVVEAQGEAEQQPRQHYVAQPDQRELHRLAVRQHQRHEDLDGDVEAGCDGDHDVLAEYGGGDEDPEDVVEECERKQRGRHLQARQPDAGEEKDDEREGEDVVQDPTLRQEPRHDGEDAHRRHDKHQHRHWPEVGDIDLPREAVVGVAIDVRVDEGAKSEGRDEGEEDCDQDGHGRHEVEDHDQRAGCDDDKHEGRVQLHFACLSGFLVRHHFSAGSRHVQKRRAQCPVGTVDQDDSSNNHHEEVGRIQLAPLARCLDRGARCTGR